MPGHEAAVGAPPQADSSNANKVRNARVRRCFFFI
jgi:hypothetical protein